MGEFFNVKRLSHRPAETSAGSRVSRVSRAHSGYLSIADRIYQEVIPRELTADTQSGTVPADRLVIAPRRAPGPAQAAGRVPGVFPQELGGVAGTVRPSGGRAAVVARGLSAAHCQQRRTDRPGVRTGPAAGRFTGPLASRPSRASKRAESGDRVVSAAQVTRGDHHRRSRANHRVRRPLWGGRSPFGGL